MVGLVCLFSVVFFLNNPTGDTAVALLKAGAETDKKDVDGRLALELAPDAQVGDSTPLFADQVCLTPLGPEVY